jgi:hypothetical protein
MKLQMFKLVAIVTFFIGWFSCTSDFNDLQDYRFKWDGSMQSEGFLPINPGTDSSYLVIDNNIISFATPYLVGTHVKEHLPTPGYGGPNAFSPHVWSIFMVFAEGTDVTKLDPIITLTTGANLTWIYHKRNDQLIKEQVDYMGIAKIGALDFSKQVDFKVICSDGSQIGYSFLAVAIGDILPCWDCD